MPTNVASRHALSPGWSTIRRPAPFSAWRLRWGRRRGRRSVLTGEGPGRRGFCPRRSAAGCWPAVGWRGSRAPVSTPGTLPPIRPRATLLATTEDGSW